MPISTRVTLQHDQTASKSTNLCSRARTWFSIVRIARSSPRSTTSLNHSSASRDTHRRQQLVHIRITRSMSPNRITKTPQLQTKPSTVSSSLAHRLNSARSTSRVRTCSSTGITRSSRPRASTSTTALTSMSRWELSVREPLA